MAEFATREPDWLPFSEALERILSSLKPLASRLEDLFDAQGCAVACQVQSRYTLPPGPTSHMDGFALRADDLTGPCSDPAGVTLKVVGASRPGSPWTDPVFPGTAIRIMTGALLPPGADTVVPVEEIQHQAAGGGAVQILADASRTDTRPTAGRYIRPPGEETREGEILAHPGDTLTSGMLTLLAAAGERAIHVHRAPRVAILVTGSELVPHGDSDALQGGVRRIDVLTPTLPILVREAGGVPLVTHRIADHVDDLKRTFLTVRDDADLILTTGGASMGDADLVKDVLDSLGFELDFWRIRMQPGSPVSFGMLPRSDDANGAFTPVLSLPGNPVSALVTCLMLGGPAIRKLGGHSRQFLPRIQATLREPLPGPAHLTRFLRVRLEAEGRGGWGAYSAGPQGSGAIRSLSLADGLAVVSEGISDPVVGEPVDVCMLPRGGWSDNQ